MRKVPVKIRQIVAAVSLVSAFLVFLLPAVIFSVDFVVVYSNELLFAAVLIALVPSAVLDYLNHKWVSMIERQMPLLVKGVSESQVTGLTIVKSFDKVVEGRMVGKPLADEVRRITLRMAWGASFEQALSEFKARVGSPIVSRFCALVLEASRSGGQIKKVFTGTAGFMEEMKQIDEDTSAQMRPYVVVIYAAFLVFLFTAVILVQSFFAPLEGYGQILSQYTITGVREFKDFFYKNMIVSAVTGGLMAGKIGERRAAGGLKHAIVLVLVGYATFFIMTPPNWM
ncbi:MAG: type II secretion system F family protein [Candidatus Bathyarchaeia archaeon]